VNGALVRLSFRRTLPLPLFVAFVILVGFAATRSWVPAATTFLDDGAAAGRADDFRRQALWLVFALLALPALVVGAAAVGSLWRQRDADWLGWRPISRTGVLGSAWLGILSTATLLVTLTALVAEATPGPAPAAWRFARVLEHDALALHPGEQQKSLRLEALPDGTRLRIEVTVAPGSGPVATIRATLGDSSQTASVFGRRTLELTATDGARELVFERSGEGAVLVLPSRSIDVIEPAASMHLASWELAWRMLLALAAWSAVALALGTWMRTAYAAGVTASLALLSTRWLAELSFLPGADLARAWRLIGEGLLPPAVAWPQVACVLLVVALGLTVARRGLERGRSLP